MPSPPNYLFARHLRASIRLNYQHWAIKQLCGFLLHPSVPTTGPSASATSASSLRIADIGTGTGLLPIELGQQLPNADIVGFDISSAQYPPTEWRPSNVRLEVHDAFKPFPEHHIGSYDIVHLRFFVTLLKSEDEVRGLVENLAALLKPGGHLQWLDANPTTASAMSLTSSVPKPATEKLVALMRKPYPAACYDWVPQAPAALRSKDLQVVVHDTISCASFPPARNLWNQCYLLGYQEFWEHAVEKEGDSEASKEVWRKAAEAVAELEDEFRAGVSMEVEYFCVVARKAE